MRWPVLVLALCPAPVAALDVCADLWFTRNLNYDRNGQCFSAPLAQAVFGDDGCTTDDAALSGAERDLVVRIRALEIEQACDIDTDLTELAVTAQALRKRMRDLPIATGAQTTCIGWRGGRLRLRAALDDIAPLTGAARPGDTLVFQFEDVGPFSFVQVLKGGRPTSAGWARIEVGEDACAALAR